MKTRRLATALDREMVSASSAQAPGLVSRMMVRSEGASSGHGLVIWTGDGKEDG